MNKPIQEYLDYYTELEIDPNYAVLISGDWGSGKTWFINKYFEEKDNVKSVYITLYGIGSLKEIDEQFFQQLHPVLSSKGMMIAGKVIKGFAKGALKIDLSGEGDTQGEINLTMPDLNLPNFLKNTEDYVLIFDDLERAGLKPEILLGYINQFVEHNGQKVIIIANEDEITGSNNYKKVKEKVVGRTFAINPSFDDAFNAFISELSENYLQEKIQNHKELIQTIFKNSKSNNLRHLRYGLTELGRIISELKKHCGRCFQKEELITDLIGFYFAIFIEINRGNLPIKHIKNFKIQLYSSLMRNDNDNKEPEVTKIVKRYPTVSFEDTVFPENFWYNFFENGTIDNKQIEKIAESAAYFEKEQPIWFKLWSYFNLTDQEFEEVLKKVEQKFEENKFANFGELAHVTGSLIKLSDEGIYPKSKKQIYSTAINQIDELFVEDKIKIELKVYNRDLTGDHNMGHQYQGIEIEDFKNFLKYFKTKYESERDKIVQQKADEIVDNLPKNPKEFIISVSKGNPQNYSHFSIISKLDQEKFVDQFKQLPPKKRRDILFTLKNRISDRNLEPEEIIWLKEVSQILKTQYSNKDESIEDHTINKVLEGLESKLSELK